MKKVVIVTGSSNGLGKFLVESFLRADYIVVGVSRTNSIKNDNFYFFKHDLSKSSDLSKKLKSFLIKNKILKKVEQVILINNAATVLPIDYFHKLSLKKIQESYQLNLHSPMMLAHFVLNAFLNKSEHILICNIISGAAFRPLINWSAYCTMKSGLKMFSDCLNLDYSENEKMKSITFSPGVMETNMQQTIRKQSINKLKSVEMFRDLKASQSLLPPEFVANSLFNLLKNPKEIQKTEYNVNEIYKKD